MPHCEGQRFDDYQLWRLLGAGTFGEVYAAENIYDREQVAIKIIKHPLSPTTLAEFLTEARAFRLKHPHIVPLLDFGIEEAEHLPFLVMPFIPNGTLLQRHPRGTRLNLSVVISYVNQLASALYYVHERRVIHRDVKPANVLLGAQNELLLSDFGIVAIAHSEHSMHTQDVVGTAIYMAPEQSLGKPQPASDQYSLAVMAYEWLCGTPPFQGNYAQLVLDHYQKAPTSPRLLNPQLSQEVDTVLLKALAKDPAARFPTIQAFAQALSQAKPTNAPPIHPTVSAQPVSSPTSNVTKTKEDWLKKGTKLYNLNKLYILNKLYSLKRFYKEALDAHNRTIPLNPNYPNTYVGNRTIPLNPNYPNTYVGQGNVLNNLKRYEEALDAYNLAIQLDPNYPDANNGKGVALHNLKRYDEALDALNRATALDPNFAMAYNNKGLVLNALKRRKEARAAFAKARKLGYKG